MNVCVCVWCVYTILRSSKLLRFFGALICSHSKWEDYWIILKYLYLIAEKFQGIKKQTFGVKYDEILAYFIKSWIKKDEIWAV